jgi:hypothetical protein
MLAPAAALVLVAVVLAACTGPGEPTTERGPVALMEDAALTAPDTVEVGVQTCHGDPEVTRLEEDGEQVRVEVTSTASNPGDACLDLVVVELDAPLGERRLVDLTSGRTIRVVPRPES